MIALAALAIASGAACCTWLAMRAIVQVHAMRLDAKMLARVEAIEARLEELQGAVNRYEMGRTRR